MNLRRINTVTLLPAVIPIGGIPMQPRKLVQRCINLDSLSFHDGISRRKTQKWLRLIANRPPFGHEGFDDSVHKPRPGFKPPLLYFGFAFKTEQVIAYTERWKIPLRDGLTWAEASGPKYTDRARGSILCGMMLMMCGHLGELCGTSFELVEPFNIEYLAMVQIYSNYNMGDRQCKDPQDEVEAIKIISEELACDGYKSEAGWWHSM